MVRILSAIGLTRVCLALAKTFSKFYGLMVNSAFSMFTKDGRIQAKVHNC